MVKFITHHREALVALACRTHSIEIRLEGKRPVSYRSLEKQRSLASDHLDWKWGVESWERSPCRVITQRVIRLRCLCYGRAWWCSAWAYVKTHTHARAHTHTGMDWDWKPAWDLCLSNTNYCLLYYEVIFLCVLIQMETIYHILISSQFANLVQYFWHTKQYISADFKWSPI